MGTNNKRGKGLICGVGVNDVNAQTHRIENGKRVKDSYYSIWKNILERVYLKNRHQQKKNIRYTEITVHPDWHRFSKLKEWLDNQPQTDWRDLYIDKDLLVKGNKVYGPDTCCFLTSQENSIFRPSVVPLGHTCYKKDKFRKSPWQSISNIGVKANGLIKYLGVYTTKEEAEVVAGRESIRRIVEVVNANPHQFIREAMMRWVDEWKQGLLLRESAFQKLGEKNNGTLQDHLC